MASAMCLKVVDQEATGEGMLRFQYNATYVDVAQGIAGAAPVFFEVSPDVTPQQFRVALTEAVIRVGLEQYPTLVLSPGDCLVDVIQRGV